LAHVIPTHMKDVAPPKIIRKAVRPDTRHASPEQAMRLRFPRRQLVSPRLEWTAAIGPFILIAEYNEKWKKIKQQVDEMLLLVQFSDFLPTHDLPTANNSFLNYCDC
jgi:hypothetical protein